MATSSNAELLSLSGERSPYKGKLGVIEQGALADMLLVDGDPIADIQLIADPSKNLLVIMKDGLIYKNLGQSEAESGNKAKAIDAWKKALAYEPDDDITSKIKQISGSK